MGQLITDWRKSTRSAENGGACVEVAVAEKTSG
jgi:hypothetical protein